MHNPTTSISNCSARSRTAAGTASGRSATILSARISEADCMGKGAFMFRGSVICRMSVYELDAAFFEDLPHLNAVILAELHEIGADQEPILQQIFLEIGLPLGGLHH